MIFVYVKREIIIDIFGKNEDNTGNNLIIKRDDSDFEYITLDEKVFEKDGKLYTTPNGIEKAFNTLFEYDAGKKNIQIYTK